MKKGNGMQLTFQNQTKSTSQ